MKFTKLDEISNQKTAYDLLMDSDNTEYNADAEKFIVDHIFNQSILENLIENSSKDHIREQCVKRIYSRKYLFNLVLDDSSWRIKLTAINMLLLNDGFSKSCDEILKNEEYGGYPSLDNLEDIAKNDNDWKNRLVACLIISDKSIFEYIACNDECKYLRYAAIFNVDNKDKLTEIIRTDSDFDVMDIACKKLNDESKLMEIYKSWWNFLRKKAVIGNIYDQQFLIDKLYSLSDWEVSIAASNNLYNPIELRDMLAGKPFQAKYTPPEPRFISDDDYQRSSFYDLLDNIYSLIMDDELQRDLANNHGKHCYPTILHISDPKIFNELLNTLDFTYFACDLWGKIIFEDTLFNMALNHPDEDSRYAAVLRIFDESQLNEIIANESSEKIKNEALWNLNLDESEFSLESKWRYVCGEACKSLNDLTKLVKIFCYSHDVYLSQVALNNIRDEEVLADIGCAFPYMVSGLGISKIKDDKLLTRIAMEAADDCAAAYAVTKIKDNGCLLEVLNNSPHSRCYSYAILHITDEEILNDIAYNHEDDYLRKVAVSKIASQDTLKDFALNDSNLYIRMQALKNIADESFLKEIALNDSNFHIRIEAVMNITDESFLKEIALNDEHSEVRVYAKTIIKWLHE